MAGMRCGGLGRSAVGGERLGMVRNAGVEQLIGHERESVTVELLVEPESEKGLR